MALVRLVLLVLRRSKSGITITRSGGGVHGFFPFVVFSSTTSNGDVPENATMSPVSAAATTKVTRLLSAVVVVVAELSVF